MPIVAHAEMDDIEDRHLGAFQTEVTADGRLITRRAFFRIPFPFDANRVVRRQGHLREKKLAYDAVIAVGMFGRNAAFVDPEDPETIPGNGIAVWPVGVRKQGENRLRTASSGDC